MFFRLIRPKLSPEVRFPARKHYCVTEVALGRAVGGRCFGRFGHHNRAHTAEKEALVRPSAPPVRPAGPEPFRQYPMLRNSASGSEIWLAVRISVGFESGKPQHGFSGLPSAGRRADFEVSRRGSGRNPARKADFGHGSTIAYQKVFATLLFSKRAQKSGPGNPSPFY
jgi:hypothetical protein